MAPPRKANPNDLPQLLDLYRQLNPSDPVLDAALAHQVFEKIMATEGMHVFVLEIDGMLASTCYLNVISNLTRGAQPYGIIENVVTDADHRNRGYGKQVIQHALQAAWGAGCYKVMLLAGSKNEATHGFYRGVGFIPDDKTGYVIRPG